MRTYYVGMAIAAAVAFSPVFGGNAESCLPEDNPELTFRNSPLYKHITEENQFVTKKYAELTLETGSWFSHVFNPSHTVVVFIGMMPPSGGNVYRFWVYQKREESANTSAVSSLNNNWEYVGTYDYVSRRAPWEFENIFFDGKQVSIRVKDDELNTVVCFSFDFNKKYQCFKYRDEIE